MNNSEILKNVESTACQVTGEPFRILNITRQQTVEKADIHFGNKNPVTIHSLRMKK
jgi:hypothetical protein